MNATNTTHQFILLGILLSLFIFSTPTVISDSDVNCYYQQLEYTVEPKECTGATSSGFGKVAYLLKNIDTKPGLFSLKIGTIENDGDHGNSMYPKLVYPGESVIFENSISVFDIDGCFWQPVIIDFQTASKICNPISNNAEILPGCGDEICAPSEIGNANCVEDCGIGWCGDGYCQEHEVNKNPICLEDCNYLETATDTSFTEEIKYVPPNINDVPTAPTTTINSTSTSHSSKYPLILIGIIFFVIIILSAVFIYLKYIHRKETKNKKRDHHEEFESEEQNSEQPFISKDISTAISLSNFTVKHGKNLILDNINLEVKRGELVCLLGPSGTGKSSIIECLVGRKKPTSGELNIFELDTDDQRVKDNLGFVPQHAELYMNQTVEQNLLSSATKYGVKKAQSKVSEILTLINLSDKEHLKASKLSGGQLKLLSLGMELIKEPELLILDEPTTGLDPNTRDNIITILSRIVTKQSKTVFFSTHHMDDAEECDKVIIISDGKVAIQGSPEKLKKKLPGRGKVVSITLDNITDDLMKKIKKISGIIKVISEGRNIKIIMEEPNAVKLAHKIDEIGGVVNKTEITNATMKEGFVYYTGKEVKE